MQNQAVLQNQEKPAVLPPKAHTSVHLAHLDGLRGLAALYVVIFHIRAYYPYLSPIVSRLVAPVSFGQYAVGVFIVLSGFCLMLPVARSADGQIRGGIRRFFLNRARRILPPYYCAIAFSLLMIAIFLHHKTGSPWDMSIPVTGIGIVSHLVLLQDAFHRTCAVIDPPLWSISVEWRIYFCFPLLVLSWRRFGPWVTTVTALMFSYSLVAAFFHLHFLSRINSQDMGLKPQFLGLFTLGMLAADITSSKNSYPSARRLPWGWLTAGALAALVLATTYIPMDTHSYPKLDFSVGLFAACLLVAASRNGGLQRALSWKPLVSIGSFAYSLYLIHFPVVQLVWQYLVNPLHLEATLSMLLHWLIALPVSVGVAYLFHLSFERPFMSKLHAHAPRNERQAEAAAISNPAP